MLTEFKSDCDYVFDAQTFREWAKSARIEDFYTEGKIKMIGDGTPVKLVSTQIAMVGHNQIFPWYCREIEIRKEDI